MKTKNIFNPNGRRISHELTQFLRDNFNFNIPTMSRLTTQEVKIVQQAIKKDPSLWGKMPHIKFYYSYGGTEFWESK